MVDLSGTRILIVEDEPAVSSLIEAAVRESGAVVIGPAPDIVTALAFISTEPIEAAIIDLIVHGAYCDPVADALAARDIPFAVTTGIGAYSDHPRLQSALTISKPFQGSYIHEVLKRLLMPAAGDQSVKG